MTGEGETRGGEERKAETRDCFLVKGALTSPSWPGCKRPPFCGGTPALQHRGSYSGGRGTAEDESFKVSVMISTRNGVLRASTHSLFLE